MLKPAAVAIIALFAGACAVGPDYQRPAVDTPASWRLTEPAARDLANTSWWLQFDDPVLAAQMRPGADERRPVLARLEGA